MVKNSKKKYLDNDEIDLLDLLKKIFTNKYLIIKSIILFFAIGLIYSLSLPNIYESSSTFYPHYEKTQNNSIRNLAGLAGLDLEQNTYSELPTSLYPNIINSIPYKIEILNSEIQIESKEIKYKEYLLEKNKKRSLLNILVNYTIGLPFKIISFFKSNETDNNDTLINDKNKYLSFSKKDNDLFQSLNSIVNLEVNKKDGYIILSVKDENKKVAAQIAQIAQEKLQERIINYKLKNSKVLYNYTNDLFEKRKSEFYNIQDSLAAFKDRNRSIKSDLFNNQLIRLQYEVDLANSIYKELAISKERADLEIKKNTPIFTIIDPVILPHSKVSPGRFLIVISYTIFGFLISIIIIFSKDSLIKIKKEIINWINQKFRLGKLSNNLL